MVEMGEALGSTGKWMIWSPEPLSSPALSSPFQISIATRLETVPPKDLTINYILSENSARFQGCFSIPFCLLGESSDL